jgi:hypothetical protein
MANSLLRWINSALLVLSVLAAIHLIYWWDTHRFRLVQGVFAPDCGEVLDSDAHYLALICQGVIDAKGPLPADLGQAGHVIADNAAKLGFTWPNNFKVNAAGEICDCAGTPFKIEVAPDRVIVTSESLYAYYFAELKKGSSETHEQ